MVDGTTLQSNHKASNSEATASRGVLSVPGWFLYLAYVLLAVIIAASVAFAIRSYQNAPAARVYIEATGLSAPQYQTLKEALGERASGSYFTADLQSMRNIALGLSWVDEVSLARDWQRGIIVRALPKQAIAKFGTERLVDAKGQVFVPADEAELALTTEQLVTLQGSKSQAPVIMQQMQQINDWYEPLGIEVVDIILTPRMTWIVRFDDGLRVIVDNENTAQKLLNLSQLLGNQLSEQRADIQAVDLRYKNGFTIAWKSERPQSTVTDAIEPETQSVTASLEPLAETD